MRLAIAMVCLLGCSSTKAESTASAVTGSSSAPIAAPTSDKLSKEDALFLTQEVYKASERVGWNCSWSGPTKESENLLTFLAFEEPVSKCAAALQSAGLARLGDCKKKGCSGGCCNQEIATTEKSKFDQSMGGFLFNCGSFTIHSVVTITTTGAEAKARIERELVPNKELIAKLGDCNLDHPPFKKHEVDAVFVRDDDGTWHYKKR